MKTTKIGLTVELIENDLSPEEQAPVLDCFLDARWKRKATRIKLTDKPQKVIVSGQIDKNTRNLPITAAIGFASWAWRKNEEGNPCLTDTGVTHVYIGDIITNLKRSHNGQHIVKTPLVMNTAQKRHKGILQLTFHENDFNLSKDMHVESIISAEFQGIGDSMVRYINSTLDEEQRMPETIKGTERMRVPFDYSESGIQSTGGEPLPAAAYVLNETPETNALYWENAHQMVMERDNAQWESLNLEGQARATVLMIAYCAQYLDYVADEVDRRNRHQLLASRLGREPYENFGDSISTWSGDCEDLATAIAQCKNAFESFRFPSNSTKYDRFRRMQDISRSYVNPLSLDAVRGMQVNEIAHVGAHMNDNFIPIDHFVAEMQKTRDGREMLKTLPVPKDYVAGLPFMIGEGTGMYEPLGFDNPRLNVMKYVYQAPSLNSFKKPISHDRNHVGSFFIGSLVGMTDYFYRRGASGPLTFWYCTEQSNGTLSRGALYDDMIHHTDRVAFRPQPPIPKRVMHLVEEAIKLRVPPRDLTLTKQEDHKTNKHLEYVKTAVAKLKRTPGPPHLTAPIYVRPHQIGSKLASNMVQDFTRLKNVWKVDYKLERITDEIWGYRVTVHVNESH